MRGRGQGIVPCGTTGESPTLSEEEHFKVIETVVKKAAGRIQVIGGAGGNCTAKVVKATQKCKDIGCTAVLSVIPYYNKPTQGGLIAHFTAINAVGIPMMLYNIPGRCGGGGMTSATIAELYKLPMVCSVKEATGNVDFASEISSVCDIAIFSGITPIGTAPGAQRRRDVSVLVRTAMRSFWARRTLAACTLGWRNAVVWPTRWAWAMTPWARSWRRRDWDACQQDRCQPHS